MTTNWIMGSWDWNGYQDRKRTIVEKRENQIGVYVLVNGIVSMLIF